MTDLCFVHRYFHATSLSWEQFSRQFRCREAALEALFLRPCFPRRELKTGFPDSLGQALQKWAEMERRELQLGVRAVGEDSAEYPEAVRAYIPPERRPAFLYVKGERIPTERELVGLVGTRRPSALGESCAISFARHFQVLGLNTLSGLARGIDTLVHQSSSSGGSFAVLGGGVCDIYPPENEHLAEILVREGGALISPFPVGQVPLPRNFPVRNEIIAALSAGVVVIEGDEKSGAAITGRHALAMGKGVAVLSQDFRSEFGKGAIRLQQAGAEFVGNESEAAELLFRRFGGISPRLFAGQKIGPPGRAGKFSLSQFQKASGLSLPDAVVLLQEGILQGKIRKSGSGYQLT